MLLNKHSLEIPARFTEQDGLRPMLAGVHLTPEHAVATDGHTLVILAHPEGNPAEYPACGQSAELVPLDPCTVPGDALARVAKSVPKKKKTLAIINNALVDTSATNTNGHVTVYTTDLESPQKAELKKLEGRYPSYHNVIPKTPPVFSIGVNPAYLEKIGRAYRDLGAVGVTVELRDRFKPVMFSGENADGQAMKTLLMPMEMEGAVGLNRSYVLRQWAENVNREHTDFWEQF